MLNVIVETVATMSDMPKASLPDQRTSGTWFMQGCPAGLAYCIAQHHVQSTVPEIVTAFSQDGDMTD